MKPSREVPRGFKLHDSHAPDGITAEGFRVVRSGGRVKFASVWWFHEALKALEGETVFCQGQDYWQTEMNVSTCHGQFKQLCRVTPWQSPADIEAARVEKERRNEAAQREMQDDDY